MWDKLLKEHLLLFLRVVIIFSLFNLLVELTNVNLIHKNIINTHKCVGKQGINKQQNYQTKLVQFKLYIGLRFGVSPIVIPGFPLLPKPHPAFITKFHPDEPETLTFVRLTLINGNTNSGKPKVTPKTKFTPLIFSRSHSSPFMTSKISPPVDRTRSKKFLISSVFLKGYGASKSLSKLYQTLSILLNAIQCLLLHRP